MRNIFIEENGIYSIDCSNAVWATDKMHEDYHNTGIHINDVDFLIENATHILMAEYKNACIANAENSAAFQPMTDKKISIVTRKFYDSLLSNNTSIRIDLFASAKIKSWLLWYAVELLCEICYDLCCIEHKKESGRR